MVQTDETLQYDDGVVPLVMDEEPEEIFVVRGGHTGGSPGRASGPRAIHLHPVNPRRSAFETAAVSGTLCCLAVATLLSAIGYSWISTNLSEGTDPQGVVTLYDVAATGMCISFSASLLLIALGLGHSARCTSSEALPLFQKAAMALCFLSACGCIIWAAGYGGLRDKAYRTGFDIPDKLTTAGVLLCHILLTAGKLRAAVSFYTEPPARDDVVTWGEAGAALLCLLGLLCYYTLAGYGANSWIRSQLPENIRVLPGKLPEGFADSENGVDICTFIGVKAGVVVLCQLALIKAPRTRGVSIFKHVLSFLMVFDCIVFAAGMALISHAKQLPDDEAFLSVAYIVGLCCYTIAAVLLVTALTKH